MTTKPKGSPDDTPQGEVVQVDAKTGEILEHSEPQSAIELVHKLVSERVKEGVDPETETMDRILESILMAETVEDALSDNEPLKASDVIGVHLTLHGVSFTESDVADARIPYYATLHGVRQDTGQRVVINCGGEQVLAQALRLDAAREWPRVVEIIQLGKEKVGRTRPYRLRLIPQPDF